MMIILFVIASLSIAMAVQLPIKLGGKNDPDDVRLLQQSLNECDDYSLKVDGIYGPATSSAVKDFQRRNMLTIDGIVGPQTWSKLASVVDIGPVDTTTGSGTTNTSSASEQVLPEESAAIIEPSAGASVQVAKSFSGSIGSNDTYTSRSVISDYSSNAAIAASSSDNASDFWKDRSTWLQPLKGAQTANPTGGARYFGASRANGARAHAGIDFIALLVRLYMQ
jgi:peptidoglycan hydrolase-like protein with peptidoglycan-binding domain